MKVMIDLNKASADEIVFLENYLMTKRMKMEHRDIFYEEEEMAERDRRDDMNLVYLVIKKKNRVNGYSRAKLEDVRKECLDKLKELTFEEVIAELEKAGRIIMFEDGYVDGL